jgi:ribosomal-protein-alanine N-acetyltransferase
MRAVEARITAPPATLAPALARQADLPALARLAADVLPGGWGETELAAELARPGARLLVVRAGPDAADVMGGAIARSSGCEVELLWIGVARSARRRGIGARLLAAVVGWARDARARVVLEVRAGNRAARAMYQAAGFVVVGRRPRYYRDGEDAVLLACEPPTEAPP